jgi:hypothetical protein
LFRGAGLFVRLVPGLLLGLAVEGVRDDSRELVLAVLDGLVEVEAPDVGDPVQDLLQTCTYIRFCSLFGLFTNLHILALLDFHLKWVRSFCGVVESHHIVLKDFLCLLR